MARPPGVRGQPLPLSQTCCVVSSPSQLQLTELSMHQRSPVYSEPEQRPIGQSRSRTHGSQLLPLPWQLPKRWAQVVTARSGSNFPQTLALPQGHESKLESQTSVQIFSPLGSRAQICPGVERQSASVSHGAQKRRRTQKGSCAPLESEIVSQKKPVGQSVSAAQLVEQ